jgi:hypothetical protein
VRVRACQTRIPSGACTWTDVDVLYPVLVMVVLGVVADGATLDVEPRVYVNGRVA